MAKINLLPWRAERRKQRQQEFLTMLGMAAAAAVLISVMIVLYYNNQIDAQTARNAYLTQQISALDAQIAEIAQLDVKKAGLLKRKQVIEELQASRSQMVHLFDEIARTIADGTQLTSVQQNGAEMTLLGRAQSNARVSTYMRNLDASGWMGSPDLAIIEQRGVDPGLPNEFSLKVLLKNPNDVPPGGVPVDPAAVTAAPDASASAPTTAVPAAASTVVAPAPATVPSSVAPGAAPPGSVQPATTPPASVPPTTPASATAPVAVGVKS